MKFKAEDEVNGIVNFIRNYYDTNKVGGAILGISGGKDSAVVSALMVKAIGCDNVIGVTLPCHSKNEDREDAKLISDYYNFKLINFDITNTFDNFKLELNNLGNFNDFQLKNSDINIKPRLRMTTLYYLAAMYSQIYGMPYLVIGTSNKCEIYVGYYTKGGDSVSDIAPIANYTVSEVIKIGEYLQVPNKVLYKTPSDGISDATDEDKLGVTYSDIEKYMIDKDSVDKEIAKRIEKLHNSNLHKRNIPTYMRDNI